MGNSLILLSLWVKQLNDQNNVWRCRVWLKEGYLRAGLNVCVGTDTFQKSDITEGMITLSTKAGPQGSSRTFLP